MKKNNLNPKKLNRNEYTAATAAEATGYTDRGIRKAIREGRLKAAREKTPFGTCYVIKREALHEFIEKI